jgi:hypothetical protein
LRVIAAPHQQQILGSIRTRQSGSIPSTTPSTARMTARDIL